MIIKKKSFSGEFVGEPIRKELKLLEEVNTIFCHEGLFLVSSFQKLMGKIKKRKSMKERDLHLQHVDWTV